jgi:hypothetical protein
MATECQHNHTIGVSCFSPPNIVWTKAKCVDCGKVLVYCNYPKADKRIDQK